MAVAQSIGTVETRGFVSAIVAADAMLKSAGVHMRDFSVVGAGLVAVVVTGDVAAVKTAVDSGRAAAENITEVISCNVIPRPGGEVNKLLEAE